MQRQTPGKIRLGSLAPTSAHRAASSRAATIGTHNNLNRAEEDEAAAACPLLTAATPSQNNGPNGPLWPGKSCPPPRPSPAPAPPRPLLR